MDHPVIITFLVLALIAFLSFAAAFVKPLALAVLLSFALAPVASRLERRIPRPLAVVLTVVASLIVLVALGLVVWGQLGALSENIDQYAGNVERQIQRLWQRGESTTLGKLNELGEKVSEQLGTAEKPLGVQDITRVEIVPHPSIMERVSDAVGPFLEVAGVGSFVLILVLFMLMHREDVRDRIVQLFGSQNVSHTTRVMDEVGGRISRYLGMLSIVNASIGLVVTLGLWTIGVDYAVLWGFLAGALRFIPYVGPGLGFLMPLLFSFASTTTPTEPILVVALFAAMETVANVVVEPVVYGKTTGISALGLLVAALFWTWLWGALGLLLSTPLTVCLAVLGKSIPSLRAFGILLGETSDLPLEVRYYQRILANDVDGGFEMIESLSREKSTAEIYDGIFLPALSLAERDEAGGAIDERQRTLLWRSTWDLVQELGSAESERSTGTPPDLKPLQVLGVAAADSADALALRMLGTLLTDSPVVLSNLDAEGSPLSLAEQIAAQAPDVVLISHVIPAGLAQARYLVRRLHTRVPGIPIIVGLWGRPEEASETAAKFIEAGAAKTVHNIEAARQALLTARPSDSQTAGVLVAAVT